MVLNKSDATKNSKLAFRLDVAAYRAIAVILVVLDHFKFKYFSFGFIGVDLFFVISGFIITRQLLHEYSESARQFNSRKGSISIKQFYLRRIRRIVPVAFLVILVTLVVNFFTIPSAKFEAIRNDGVWASLFLANIRFMMQGQEYFGVEVEKSPFLHYWSLAVEEQFYLVWPLVILSAAAWWGLKINGRRFSFIQRIRWTIGLITLLSFLSFQILSFTSGGQFYYSSLTRMWELGVGGYCAALGASTLDETTARKVSTLRRVSFLALPLFVVFLNEERIPFLVPLVVFCFAVVLMSEREIVFSKSVYGKILSHSFFQFIGAISYSMYLWHWPIFIYAENFGFGERLWHKVILVALTLIFSVFSYKYVEQVFRSKKALNLVPPMADSKLRQNFYNTLKFKFTAFSLTMFVFLGFINYNMETVLSGISNRFYIESDEIEQLASLEPDLDFDSEGTNSGGVQEVPQNSSLSGPTESQIFEQVSLASSVTQISESNVRLLQSNTTKDAFSLLPTICLKTEKNFSVPSGLCSFVSPEPNAKRIVVLGDSKGGNLNPALAELSRIGYSVVNWSMPGCRYLAPDSAAIRATEKVQAPGCDDRRKWINENLESEQFDGAVVSDFPPSSDQFAGNIDLIRKLSQTISNVVVIINTPRNRTPTDCVSKGGEFVANCFVLDTFWQKNIKDYTKLLISNNIDFLDFTQYFCSASNYVCPPEVDGKLTTKDGSHALLDYGIYIATSQATRLRDKLTG